MRSAVSLILTLYLSIVFLVFEGFGELDSWCRVQFCGVLDVGRQG
jgi:hypothetical protein